MIVKHKFVSNKANSNDLSLVNPSNWNEDHVVIGGEFPGPSEYNFEPQCFNTPLVAGVAASITLAPVPLGLNASDQGHYIYISGGTGAAESVLITGGNAVSGANTGTIIFTPVNAHSGTWCISSGSAGIQEAINENEAVYIPPGTYDICSTISLPCAVQIAGAGNTVTVLRAMRSNLVFFANINRNQGENGCLHQWNISGLVLDGEGFYPNTIKGFEVIDIHLGGYYQTGSFLNFDKIAFYNVWQAFYMDRVMNVQITNIRSTDNTTAWFGSTQAMAESRSYSITINGWFHNPADRPLPACVWTLTSADALITFEYVLTSRIINFATQSAGRAVGVRFKGLCEDVSLESSSIIAAWNGVELVPGSAPDHGPNWVKIINSHIDNLEVAAILLAAQSYHTIINNNQISNNGGPSTAEAIKVIGACAGVLMCNNIFQNWGTPAGSIDCRCIRLSHGSNIQIDGNLFANYTPPARNIRVEGQCTRYSIINNIFWSGGGPSTDPIDDTISDIQRIIMNNRYSEVDVLRPQIEGPFINCENKVNKYNIREEIGRIDGTAAENIYDHHTSGNNHDGDFRLTFQGGTTTAWNGRLLFYGYDVDMFNIKRLILPRITFANLPPPVLGGLLYCTDGTTGSNPLTGGGLGCVAWSSGGKWQGIPD